MSDEAAQAAWVPNRGGACTTASVLAALRLLGARALPDLGEATLALGAPAPCRPPPLLAYVGVPGRRAPLDERIEAMASSHGLTVRASTALVIPGLPVSPRDTEVVVANLAWGQESPGQCGSWGWHPLRPSTYATGGHSVVVVTADGGHWLVLDPNHRGLQRWDRPGLAVTVTRIRKV